MDYTTLTLTSDRLMLIPVNESYIEDIFKEMNASVTLYMYPAPAKDIQETVNFVQGKQPFLISGTDYTFCILKKDTFEFIGCGGVHNLDKASPEFGIWTKQSVHGNHYGFEAIVCAYEYFKDQFTSFIYPADKDNIASILIAKRLGGVLDKRYDEYSMDKRILHIEEYLIPGMKKE